jgi:mRNA-degrading endonuclease toxin of MazEF toxin-antitoxin module
MDEIIQKFKEWFKLKIKLSFKEDSLVFKQNEIWWCSLGLNLGEETYGKGEKFTRPVLIFKKLTSSSFVAFPLTTQERIGSWYAKIETQGIKRWVMLNQIRILDKKRLTNRIGALSGADVQEVKKSFINLYCS